MTTPLSFPDRLAAMARPLLGSPAIRWLAYLGLCAAYLQGGLKKLFDINAAVGEMHHFGLQPALPLAMLVIVLELGASLLILSGKLRWLGALMLALFTLMATFVALRFWQMPVGPERFGAANSFFEHLGLVGGFLLVAWLDLQPAPPASQR